MIIAVFFLSLITGFFVLQFRLVSKVLGGYESALQDTARRKVELYVDGLRAFAAHAARQAGGEAPALRDIASRDERVRGVRLVRPDGYVAAAVPGPQGYIYGGSPAFDRALAGEAFVAGGDAGQATVGAPVRDAAGRVTGVLLVDFSLAPFLNELTQEFYHRDYRIALADAGNRPLLWPFAREKLESFASYEDRFDDGNARYRVGRVEIPHTSWQLYFFLRDYNFETQRVVTILVLLFALYFSLYEFLVGFLRASSINSYFEDVNFAVFNHLREGVIICNNLNRIVFANEAAQRFLAGYRPNLRGAKLEDILGPAGVEMGGENRKVLLRTGEDLLEVVSSPIFKEGRMLGSLVVLGPAAEQEKAAGQVLAKFFDISRDGLVYVDRNHQVAMANIMANCYLGPLEKGTHIREVEPRLAEALEENAGSHSLAKVDLGTSVSCEIAPVYDEQGRYTGALVLLRDTGDGGLAEGL